MVKRGALAIARAFFVLWLAIAAFYISTMITVHWNIIVFAIVFVAGIIWLTKSSKEPRGTYGVDILSPLIIIGLVAFILIWGGIFWW